MRQVIAGVVFASVFVAGQTPPPKPANQTAPKPAPPAQGRPAAPPYEDWSRLPVSPEIHPDRRVTFRLFSPKATEALLVSGLLESVLKGPRPMQKDPQGVWSATVGPLEPDIYDYGFAVDGGLRIPDPANPNVVSVRRGPASYFEVPAATPQFYDPRPVPRGEVHEHWYFSKSLGMNRRLLVYTPPGYEGDEDIRYPVLYLLHGSGQTEESWATIGRANFIMDNLLAEKSARDMIIVMPYGHRERAMSVQERMGVRANSSDIEKDLIGDVIPFVEGRYTVEKGRDGRAIAGLSMGGFQSIAIGAARQELFSRIGSFSGGVRSDDGYEKTLGPLMEDPQKLKLFWIACGKEDSLFESNRKLDEWLTKQKIPHTFRVTEGAHTWRNWRRYLYDFIPLLFPRQPAS